ncbi:MAG: aminotriazole resistance protein [Christensenellaceae bacterium]|jgi:energy-coupling factor transport system substrate-specific component|nr:aminotriazole resistance protein [Christensenellaceae bacterium]
MENQKKKFSFVNIIFFVIFGVLTGVVWAYLSPIPLIPGQVHFRTFAFIIPAIGYLFGPVSGFFAGYIGTIVWALLAGMFVPLHSPLTDGITVGLSAALPALIHLKNGKLELLDVIAESKSKFIIKSEILCVGFGILMIVTTSLSLSYFTGTDYWFAVSMIGIADVVPIALTPFVVLWLAPLLKNVRNIVPYV